MLSRSPRDFFEITALTRSKIACIDQTLPPLFSNRFNFIFSQFSKPKKAELATMAASSPLILMSQLTEFISILETDFDELINVLEEFDTISKEIITRFGHTDLGIQLKTLLMETESLVLEQIPKKQKKLAIVAEKADDEMVNKILAQLKKSNPESLNPNHPEAQILWRSKIRGKKGENPLGEEMRKIGSKDDAVSLVVLTQLMGNQEDLTYALRKVDPESYEEFRKGVLGLKSFEELKKNGLSSGLISLSNLKRRVEKAQGVCKPEMVLASHKES